MIMFIYDGCLTIVYSCTFKKTKQKKCSEKKHMEVKNNRCLEEIEQVPLDKDPWLGEKQDIALETMLPDTPMDQQGASDEDSDEEEDSETDDSGTIIQNQHHTPHKIDLEKHPIPSNKKKHN